MYNPMTKSEAKWLQRKYGMEIARDPVTQQAKKLIVSSDVLLPELDKYIDYQDAHMWEQPTPGNATAVREQEGNGYRYTIHCPKSWFDLWGWKDE